MGLLAGCSGKGGDTINIGVAGPMTGDQSKMGMDFKNGVTLAVEQWNSKGGVLGKKVVVQIEDDQHDPKQAVAIANKLVNEGAAGVIGHFNSSCSIPASKIYEDGGVPMITPATTNPQLTEQGFWNVFRVCGRDDQQGKVAAEFVSKDLGKKRIAVLHDKTTYGQGLANEFQKNLSGSAKVVYYGSIIQGDKDFKSVLTSIKETNPEIIYFGGIYPEAGLMMKQAREIGLDATFVSGDGSIDPKLLDIAGAAAEGTYLSFSPDPVNIPSAKGFLDEYHKRFGEHGPYSIYAYDAANILLKSINTVGSVDGKAVADAIHKGSFDGALGKVEFDKKGDNKIAHYVMWQVKGGKFVQVTN
ncbi:MAG: branched-chain amino acid ABC transporter substrate-binding protein [Nitrospirota bacterium]